MEPNKNDRYENLISYADELHAKNKKRIKVSGIVLVLLPVVLGLVRWLTDSDKILFLLIWVLCMFALAAYLVSIEYLDHVLHEKLNWMTGEEKEQESLIDGQELVPSKVREKVRNRLDPETPETDEEGGGE